MRNDYHVHPKRRITLFNQFNHAHGGIVQEDYLVSCQGGSDGGGINSDKAIGG